MKMPRQAIVIAILTTMGDENTLLEGFLAILWKLISS